MLISVVNYFYEVTPDILLFLYVLVRLSSTFTPVDAINDTGTSSPLDSKTISCPLELYEHRLSTGELRPDENQLVVIKHLQKLSDELKGYKHKPPTDGMVSEMSTVCSSVCVIMYCYTKLLWQTVSNT